MILVVRRTEGRKTYFDKAVKFASTKADYVSGKLPIGATYEVDVVNGLCKAPGAHNRVN